jgi:hypothetical protein
MRLETIPIVLGVLVILVGGAVATDAWGDPERGPMRDRRRRIRASIDRLGEGMVGGGTVLLGAVLIGRDVWRFGTIVVLVGAILVIWGGIRNRDYIRESFLFRGAARRGLERPIKNAGKKLRIR